MSHKQILSFNNRKVTTKDKITILIKNNGDPLSLYYEFVHALADLILNYSKLDVSTGV